VAGDCVLRRLVPSDLAAFQAYRHDSEVALYQDWSATSDSEASAFLAHMGTGALLRPGTWSQIGICERDDPLLIGDIGLFLYEDSGSAELGITLRRESQGRGFATAAGRAAIELVFEQTPALEVRGITDARNVPSMRLLERVGMRLIESRSAVFRGEPCVEHVYAVTRP
jgi:RimJ/RimL family protein N-acetyltransferase